VDWLVIRALTQLTVRPAVTIALHDRDIEMEEERSVSQAQFAIEKGGLA